jgi:hypothetical protein
VDRAVLMLPTADREATLKSLDACAALAGRLT